MLTSSSRMVGGGSNRGVLGVGGLSDLAKGHVVSTVKNMFWFILFRSRNMTISPAIKE